MSKLKDLFFGSDEERSNNESEEIKLANEEVKNVVQYKVKPAEAKNTDKK